MSSGRAASWGPRRRRTSSRAAAPSPAPPPDRSRGVKARSINGLRSRMRTGPRRSGDSPAPDRPPASGAPGRAGSRPPRSGNGAGPSPAAASGRAACGRSRGILRRSGEIEGSSALAVAPAQVRRFVPAAAVVGAVAQSSGSRGLLPRRPPGPARHPYVSRGPRPRTERGPFFQLGAVGPTTRNRVTTSPPTWARSLPRIDGRQQPQLGRPGRGLRHDQQLALGEGLRRAVVGDLRADQRRPAAEDRPTRVRSDQSCSVTSESTRRPSGCGSSAPGRHRSTCGAGRRCGGGWAAGGPPRRRAPPRARRGRCRSAGPGRSSLTAPPPVDPARPRPRHHLHQDGDAVAHLDPRAAQFRRHVVDHRRGDQRLLGRAGHRGQGRPAFGVEGGEDVVQDQDGVLALGPQERERRELQRQGERPRLPVAGEALRRRRAEVDDQVVAVRADEGHAAVELVPRRSATRSRIASVSSAAVGSASRPPGRCRRPPRNGRAVPERRRPRALAGHLRIGAGQVRREVGDQRAGRRAAARRSRSGARPRRRGSRSPCPGPAVRSSAGRCAA